MSNAFVGASFKSHLRYASQRQYLESFFFLHSTTDRKESINQYLEKVSLSQVDCLHENVKEHSNILLQIKILILQI